MRCHSHTFQQSTLRSGSMLRPSPVMCTSPMYTLKYEHDLSRMAYTIDTIPSTIFIVITLRYHHEGTIKDLLSAIRSSGLYDKCSKIFLRFEEEPNKMIVNFCKLNFNKIEIHSSSNYDVIDFLDVRFQDPDVYILCYNLAKIRKDSIHELMLEHIVHEWKYCIQTLLDDKSIRATGLFPSTLKDTYFWFNTFWIRTDKTKKLDSLELTERKPIMICSKPELFVSTAEIESAIMKVQDKPDDDEQSFTSLPPWGNQLSQPPPKGKVTWQDHI